MTCTCDKPRNQLISPDPRRAGSCKQCGKLLPKQRVYVAGPMSGIPQFNVPAFDAAAEDLRGRGYDVVSPAEIDHPETRAASLASPDGSPSSGQVNGETWGDFLSRDIKLIVDHGIEAIFVLPDWQTSRGARLETFVAHLCDLPVFTLEGKPVSRHDLSIAWTFGV